MHKLSTAYDFLKSSWAALLAILAFLGLVIEVMFNLVGILDWGRGWFCPPVVALQVQHSAPGPDCLKFAFDRLPKKFRLGEIGLKVVSLEGPAPISGDQAGAIFHRQIDMEVTPPRIEPGQTITFSAELVADRMMDSAYVELCPVLAQPGTTATISIIPVFLDVLGNSIARLEVRYPEGTSPEVGIPIKLTRSKSLETELRAPP